MDRTHSKLRLRAIKNAKTPRLPVIRKLAKSLRLSTKKPESAGGLGLLLGCRLCGKMCKLTAAPLAVVVAHGSLPLAVHKHHFRAACLHSIPHTAETSQLNRSSSGSFLSSLR